MPVNQLHQKATYWGSPVSTGYGGQTFGAPVLIDCRWADKTAKVVNPSGEEFVSKTTAYVDRDVDIGGYLALGDQTATALPTSLKDAQIIQQFHKIPDIQALGYLRKAYL